MRKTAVTLLVASTGLSFAGQSPKQALVPAAVIPKSSGCPQCLGYSGLFVGAGVDYLFDADTAYYTGRAGYEWANPQAKYSQSLFLEAGWLDNDAGFNSYQAIPVTVNYEYKRALTRCLNFYVGGGLGVAFTDSETPLDPTKPNETFNDSDTVFVMQAFAGLTYCLTENLELYGGVRYLWSDDLGSNSGLDDWSIGGGLRMKF